MTFEIDGTPFFMERWPEGSYAPAYTLGRLADGSTFVSDRGVQQDRHTAKGYLTGTKDEVSAMLAVLEEARGQAVTMEDVREYVFTPLVDIAQDIEAVFTYGISSGGFGITDRLYRVPVSIEAVRPASVAVTPSLATLRVRAGYEAGVDIDATPLVSLGRVAYAVDQGGDEGVLRGSFFQSTAETAAILRFIESSRGAAASVPDFGIGVTGTGRVRLMGVRRSDPIHWEVRLEWLMQ